MLTQEKLKELFDYNPETGDLIWKVDRGSKKMRGKIAGNKHYSGYVRLRINCKHYAAHRLIWVWHYGQIPEKDLDHINNIRSDNRIENLREATRSENMQNEKKARSTNTHGFLGVTKNNGRWSAQIWLNNKNIYLGTFGSPEAAHAAYLEAKRKLHPYQTIA